MKIRTGRSRSQRAGVSSCRRRFRVDGGFSLVEVLICTLVLTIGLLGIAALLAVTTQMQIGAREATRAMRLAESKVDQLVKLDFDDAEVTVGGSLTENVDNYFEEPLSGVTVRWLVEGGPADTRVVTVHVENLRAQQFGRRTDLTTIIRQW